MELPKLKILKNGLKVLHVPFKGIQTVSIAMIGKAGSNYEANDQIGVAHLLEHAVFDGTKDYPTYKELEKLISGVGGYRNATTSRGIVTYFARVLKEDASHAFEHISQVVIYPNLKPKTVTREREIVIQEAIRTFDNPRSRFYIDSNKMYFPNQRISVPIIGELEDIEKITNKSVRQYFKNAYNAQNFVLSICSSLDEQEVFDLAEKYFIDMPLGANLSMEVPTYNNEDSYYVVNKPEVNQTTFVHSYYAPKSETDNYFAACLLEKILEERLFDTIRTKLGFSYSIGPDYIADDNYGLFGIYAELSDKNFGNMVKALQQEQKKIATTLVDDDEFTRAQKDVQSSTVFYAESPLNRAKYFGKKFLLDRKYKFPQEFIDNCLAVTKEEVREVANNIFSQNKKTAVLSKSITADVVEKIFS